jgi:hypothetical protein
MLKMCKTMISLELPDNVTKIKYGAIFCCHSLLNVAFPSDVDIGMDIFVGEFDGGGRLL